MSLMPGMTLRDQLVLGFLEASSATSHDILRSDFGLPLRTSYAASSPPVYINVWDFEAGREEHEAQDNSLGFFDSHFPTEVNVHEKIKDDVVRAGNTLRHEHIHLLQLRNRMRLGTTTQDDLCDEFLETDETIKEALYLSKESELMPRLHQLVSSFHMLGGRVPVTKKQFFDFLDICLADGEPDPAKAADYVFLFNRMANQETSFLLDKFYELSDKDINEIGLALEVVKPEKLPVLKDFLLRGYFKLLDIYREYSVFDVPLEPVPPQPLSGNYKLNSVRFEI